MVIVAINAGHTGSSPGAVGKGKLTEYEVVHDIAERVIAHLKDNKEIIPIRAYQSSGGTYRQSFNELIRSMNALCPDILLSIHCNASIIAPRIDRIESYYPLGDESSVRFARILATEVRKGEKTSGACAALGNGAVAPKKGVNGLSLLRKFLPGPYSVLTKTNAKTRALIEIGFINRVDTEKLMRSDVFREEVARDIYRAILLTLGLT